MNWDQIEGKWKHVTGSAQERWGKLTDDDWKATAGKKDQLVGRIQSDMDSQRKPKSRLTSGLARRSKPA
jgi:uncharacterized protein YjbJ (UPF0337 family)